MTPPVLNVLTFINNLHLFISISLMCVFHVDYCSIINVVLCYFLSLLFCIVTVSYCCIHVTSTIYCCVIFVTVIHSYKILLCLSYLAYCRCMYVALVSIRMCLSVQNISKVGGEYKISQTFDIVLA